MYPPVPKTVMSWLHMSLCKQQATLLPPPQVGILLSGRILQQTSQQQRTLKSQAPQSHPVTPGLLAPAARRQAGSAATLVSIPQPPLTQTMPSTITVSAMSITQE